MVKVEDSGGNVVTSVNSGTASATIASGSGGSIAAGGTSGTFASGVATFSGLALNGVNGNVYTFTFSGDGFTSAASSNITVTTGAATKLVITTQPSATDASGAALAQQPVVKVEDSGGNVVTSVNSGTASATIASGSGGSIAAGGTSGTFASGVATFSGLALNGVNGNVYTFTFSGDGFTSAASSNITVTTGAATQLLFSTQPVAAASGAAFSTQPVVKVEDSGGNVVTSSSQTITLTASGGTLSSCSALTASAGVINVSNCTFAGLVGTNYTVTAQTTSAPIVSGTSANFSPSTFGTATQIVLSGVTTNLGGGGSRTFTATIEDSAGNIVTSGTDSSRSVTFAKTSGSGSVTGLGSVSATGGLASDSVTGNAAGSVTLSASATLTQGATNSNPLTITVTAAPTISFPTTASPYNAGHNAGVETLHITGTNFQSGLSVTANGAFTINSIGSVTATSITVTLTGSGGTNATGSLTVTNPDGGTVTTTNSLNNGGIYNG